MCTGIRLNAEDGSIIYARTLEFGEDVQSNILMIPRNYVLAGTTAFQNAKGLSWKSKYAAVGANMLNLIGIADGVNEEGLAGGLFYFPDYAQFQHTLIDQADNSIAPWELITWILTNFSSVDEVKKSLLNIKVSQTIFGPWGFVPPIHAIVHDLTGKSLVIEYVKGELFLHDNPLGIITNSPTFDWHFTNLSNYINMSLINVEKLQLDGVTLHPLSQGTGMLGLPGDFTSPSRFVRASLFVSACINKKNSTEAVDSAFHILNLFDIPVGSVIEKSAKQNFYEYTQWTSASDLKNKRFYWHTYQSRPIQMIDLMKMDLNSSDTRTIQMNRKNNIYDLTSKV